MIEVPAGHSREIAYTNKQAGVFYGETNGAHRSGWQGWRIMSTEMMDDYSIAIAGRRLNKADALRAYAYPHQFIREYSNGLRETLTLLDSIDALVVEVDNLHGKELMVKSLFADPPDAFVTSFEKGVLLMAKNRHMQRTPKENYPVWIGVTIASRSKNPSFESDTVDQSFSSAGLNCAIEHQKSEIVFVVGDTKEEAITLANDVATKYSVLIAQRKKSMEDLLNRSYVRTDNTRFDKALYWAKISLDALIMNQRGKGIFAGLPWFDD